MKAMSVKKVMGLLAALGLPFTTSIATAADYTAWSGHRTIVLNTSATGAAVNEDVFNFPVLIRLGANEASILSEANNGNSIRFSKADNATPLPYEIETWSATGAAIWVKVDTIKGNNSTQSIRLHWGNAAATSESNGAAVFDTANGFSGVWHMGADSVGVSRDATANRNHAVQQGTATAMQGAIAGARRLNASGGGDIDTVGINQSFNMSVNDRVTVSAWVRREGGNAAGSAFEGIAGVFDWNRSGTGVNNRMYSLVHNANNGFSFHVSSTGGDGANEVIVNSGIIGEAAWTHAAATVDGANITVYVNGVPATQAPYTGNIYFPANLANVGPFTIGMLDDNGSGEGQYFNGGVDEVRLSGVARSAAWMKLEHANQKPLNTLVDIGQPSPPGAPTGVTATPGAVNSNSIIVGWTAPTNNGGLDINAYKAVVVGDTLRSCTPVAGQLACTITGLTPGSLYTFQVRAYNAAGASPFSNPNATPVPAPTGLLSGGSMFQVGAFTGAYTFRLSDALDGAGDRLGMSVVDVKGRTVWSRAVSAQDAGRTITWDGRTTTGARAAAGVYLVRVYALTAAGKMEAVKGGVTVGR